MIQDIDEINVVLSDTGSIDVSIDNDNSISVNEGTPTDIAEIMHNEQIRQENEAQRIANEEQRIENETAREDYINDLKQRVLDGEFNGEDGQDGFSPIANVSKSGDTATITITDKNGTTTASISDGTDGRDGVDGQDGTDGEDGFSPVVTMEKQGKVTTLTITDATGTHTTEIKDGNDGSGTGDMLKSTYDTNDNGVVDNAEKVNNHTVLTDVPADAVFTDTTYTAGTGITISAENVISNTQTSAAWGNITGTLSNQTDLSNALSGKQDTIDSSHKLNADLVDDSTSTNKFVSSTDITNWNNKSDFIPFTNEIKKGTQNDPIILSDLEPGEYLHSETYTTNSRMYVKLTSSHAAVYIEISGENRVLVIPKKIDATGLSNGEEVAYFLEGEISTNYNNKLPSIVRTTIKYLTHISNINFSTQYYLTIPAVGTSFNQTIAGVKTFMALPQYYYNLEPVLDNELTTKAYVDNNFEYQKTSLPTASADFYGSIFQYVGTTNANYTNGYYYKCTRSGTSPNYTYSWERLDVQPSFSGNYNDLTNKPTIPDELADLSDDSTHRLVTDTEKTTWSGKQDALVSGTNIKTINSTSLLGSGDIEVGADIPQQDTAPLNPSEDDLWIDTDADTNIITVDNSVSTTSPNPISNQAITNYVKGEVLYYDVNGTTGTVNLSDSVANYDYIEIFYKQAQYTNIYSSVKVYDANNKQASLVAVQSENGGAGIVSAYVVISGTTIRKADYNIFWTNGGNEHTDKIYITRVVGYK